MDRDNDPIYSIRSVGFHVCVPTAMKHFARGTVQ
jgi:hypothetical protein